MQRYYTLLHGVSTLYSSDSAKRTTLLEDNLATIVSKQHPLTATAWRQVATDSKRLLQVWLAKEKNDPTAEVMAGQIMEILNELSDEEAMPKIVITEIVPPVVRPPVVVAAVTSDAPDAPVSAVTPVAPVAEEKVVIKEVTITETLASEEIEVLEEADDVDEDADAAVEEEDEEVEEEEGEEEEIEEEVEIEVEKVEEKAPAPAPEEEVLEPEEEPEEAEEDAEEDAADGMEVQQIHIRGKPFWLDAASNKIYAVDGEDDVGDHVGDLVNGKPRMLAAVA